MALIASMSCENKQGKPKEKFVSEQAAKRALHHKRRFRNRRFPKVYACPSCHGYHITGGSDL